MKIDRNDGVVEMRAGANAVDVGNGLTALSPVYQRSLATVSLVHIKPINDAVGFVSNSSTTV